MDWTILFTIELSNGTLKVVCMFKSCFTFHLIDWQISIPLTTTLDLFSTSYSRFLSLSSNDLKRRPLILTIQFVTTMNLLCTKSENLESYSLRVFVKNYLISFGSHLVLFFNGQTASIKFPRLTDKFPYTLTMGQNFIKLQIFLKTLESSFFGNNVRIKA
jgi:hypothetical protein